MERVAGGGERSQGSLLLTSGSRGRNFLRQHDWGVISEEARWGNHLSNWINNCPGDFKPLYYKRYVDDTFAIFRNRQQAESFF